jgi:hypothetical protein
MVRDLYSWDHTNQDRASKKFRAFCLYGLNNFWRKDFLFARHFGQVGIKTEILVPIEPVVEKGLRYFHYDES